MKQIDEILDGVRTVAILGHVRPDGDCVGSCLGLWNYLAENRPELTAHVFLESFSPAFMFLNGADWVCHESDPETIYDLALVLDASDKERLGGFAEIFDHAKKTACIDHHITNTNYAQTMHVCPDRSAASEVLFTLMREEAISKKTAECLYTGIVHDTGVFKHSNTTRSTMEIAGALIEKGINFSEIIDRTFYEKTYIQNQLLGRALTESIVFLHGTCIFSAIRQKTLDFYQASSKDLDGIIDQMRITKGVECAIFLYEINPQEFKVSMRSNGCVDVSKIAFYYGGGGHVRAAGCTMTGTIHDVINNLSAYIEKQLIDAGVLS